MNRSWPFASAILALIILHGCATPVESDNTAGTTPDTTATQDPLRAQANDLIDRLVGQWVDAPAEDSTIFHEQWQRSDADNYRGIGFVMLGNDTISIEHLNILHTDTGTYYSAEIPSQNEGAPVFFELTSASDSLVFENQQHDFPNRIVYRPQDRGWVANVTGEIRGEARALQFHLMPREEGTRNDR